MSNIPLFLGENIVVTDTETSENSQNFDTEMNCNGAVLSGVSEIKSDKFTFNSAGEFDMKGSFISNLADATSEDQCVPLKQVNEIVTVEKSRAEQSESEIIASLEAEVIRAKAKEDELLSEIEDVKKDMDKLFKFFFKDERNPGSKKT